MMASTDAAAGAPVEKRPTPEPAGRKSSVPISLTAIAWVATLLISRLPEILLNDVLRIGTPWMPYAVIALSAALWIAARFTAALRPLERYLAVMTVLAVLLAVIPLVFQSAPWRSIVPPGGHPMILLLAERMLLGLLAVVMIGIVLLLGTRPRDAYLAPGDLDAPTTSRKRGGELLRWGTFGPIMLVILALLTAWVAAPQLRGGIDVGAALPLLPIAALAALLNAFWEEVAYRAAPLSQLGRAIAPSAGVVILAVWFGLGHYYGGIPSGPIGAAVTAAVALLFGRAMIETGGLAWPVALHFVGDLVIYVFLALAATAPNGA